MAVDARSEATSPVVIPRRSGGEFPGGGHFGIVEVVDEGGDSIVVELIGLDWQGAELTSLRTEFDAPVGSAP